VGVGEKNAADLVGAGARTRGVGSYWTPLPPHGENAPASGRDDRRRRQVRPIGGGIMLVTLSGGQSFDPCSVAEVMVSM
jgi:hypothetical protein